MDQLNKTFITGDTTFITGDTAFGASRTTYILWKFNNETGNYQIICEMKPTGKIKSFIRKIKKWIV